MPKTDKYYKRLADSASPHSPVLKNCVKAFVYGGIICVIGQIISDKPLFFFLNSYTGGLSPTILNYLVKEYIPPCKNGKVFTDEIGLKVTDKDIILPCGNTTIWTESDI